MVSNIQINTAWCKGCGICAAFCPKKVLGVKNAKVVVENGEACISCKLCQYRCPDFAIFIEEGVK